MTLAGDSAAAWVPDDDPVRPWDEAADLAADWLWQQAESEGVAPILVTNVQKNYWGISALDEIARAGGHTTPRSRMRFDHAPVFAYVPSAASLRLAINLARGFSLVAVEGSTFSLAEWAAGADAINLLTNAVSSTSIPEDVRRDLDSVVFFGGRNGWTGPDEKEHARRYLSEHVRAKRLDPEQASSYVMAQGASDRGAKRLREILDREARHRGF
ncbi:hypothetical protein AWC11_16995 [Mycobacterium interjectum]|nr:hypothetical protein AWC11_16995 [Mycobacterium interjectum]